METKRKLLIGVFVFLLILVGLLALFMRRSEEMTGEGCLSKPGPVRVSHTARPFYMGFSTWPPDVTPEAIGKMYQFIAEHGDLILHHFDNGVPWQEALEGREFPLNLRENWERKKDNSPEGHKVFIAITPLDIKRENLAPYWGEKDNMPLPAPWSSYKLNSPEVKQAYLNYARRVVEFFNPDYFAIGIEVNMLITNDREKWRQYTELHRYVYSKLKRDYPSLPIFATLEWNHLSGIDPKADAVVQKKEVKDFMDSNDILGLSVYPYMFDSGRGYPAGAFTIKENLFDIAQEFGKPIAVAETGAPSKSFSAFGINYRFDEDYQKSYIDLLLRKAHEYDFVFVINWTAIDYDKLLRLLGARKELGMMWAYTGLERSDGCRKKALYLWDAYFKLPKE